VPKFLVAVRYSPEGVKGLLSGGGTARRAAVQSAVEALGGTLESFHFAFGEDDAFVIVDMPDNESAAAIGLVVGASGLVSSRTVVLLTPEQIDAAAAKQVEWRGPGQ
jgi:uncharacterized protein with GYD domain